MREWEEHVIKEPNINTLQKRWATFIRKLVELEEEALAIHCDLANLKTDLLRESEKKQP